MVDISFPRALAVVAEQDPDATAVVCDNRSLTRGELDRASSRMARAYALHGVGQGDLVTIALPNGVDWFVATMAAWKIGAVPNPISPQLPEAERDAILDRAKPSLVVTPAFEVDVSLPDGELPDRVSPIERVITSGGSTGLPKLIYARNAATYDPRSPVAMFAAKRAVLVPGPLYHGIPYASSWRSVFAGATAVVLPRFNAACCLELIEWYRVDRVSFVPTMMQRIIRLPEAERRSRDLGSLDAVVTSGAPCPSWLMRAWIDWLGPEVMYETFGSTERIGGTMINGTEWLEHPGSVGKAAGGSRIRILDPDTHEDCPSGQMGEIFMMPAAGPGSSYRYVGAESRSTTDGWESVGDMGYLDEDGYLFLGDRRTDMILCRGRNIYPAEIEAVLDAHPKVSSSAVIGLSDDDLGQSIHAVVQATGVTEAELVEHVRAYLVHYKVPTSIEFVTEQLRDDAGKVRRSALREARSI